MRIRLIDEPTPIEYRRMGVDPDKGFALCDFPCPPTWNMNRMICHRNWPVWAFFNEDDFMIIIIAPDCEAMASRYKTLRKLAESVPNE